MSAPDDQTFKADCEQWRGYSPCAVQRETGCADCAGCGQYRPAPAVLDIRTEPYDPSRLADAERVGIIETGGLGSHVRTSGVTRAIHDVNPDAEIVWFTHERGTELLRLIPGVTPVDVESPERLAAAGPLVRELDVVLNFELGDEAAQLVQHARCVGVFALNAQGHFQPASADADLLQRLQIDNSFRSSYAEPMQHALVRATGLDARHASHDIDVPAASRAVARAHIDELFGGRPEQLVGINVGTSLKGQVRRWPPDHIAELAVHLTTGRDDRGVLVLWGPSDAEPRDAVRAALDRLGADPAKVRMLPRQVPVDQFLGIVGSVDVLVTADSFALHGAAALGTPIVGVVGPMPHRELEINRHDHLIGPALSCSPCFNRCTHQVTGACMKAIPASAVAPQVERRLSRALEPPQAAPGVDVARPRGPGAAAGAVPGGPGIAPVRIKARRPRPAKPPVTPHRRPRGPGAGPER